MRRGKDGERMGKGWVDIGGFVAARNYCACEEDTGWAREGERDFEELQRAAPIGEDTS